MFLPALITFKAPSSIGSRNPPSKPTPDTTYEHTAFAALPARSTALSVTFFLPRLDVPAAADNSIDIGPDTVSVDTPVTNASWVFKGSPVSKTSPRPRSNRENSR
jgi:hypothetical protein